MRRLWRSSLDQVTPYEAGPSLEDVQRELGLASLVRLSANENPLGPSPRVIEAIRAEAVRAHLYPDGGSTALRRALGEWIGVPPEWIVAGNGGDEVVALVARAAFEAGDEVVLPHPAFEPYLTETLIAGATPVRSPLQGYDTDLGDMARRITPRTRAVFVCTPHNPASTLVPATPLEGFLRGLGDDAPLVVVDEAYRDFCDHPDTPDGAALARRYPTVIALRTFSKIAGLAGLRVGYAVARPEVIERLNRVRAPYNVNRLAQVAAVAALGDRAHLERTRAVVLAERARLSAALRERGATVPPSQSNFLLVRVGEAAETLRAALAKAGILVRSGAGVGFPGHLRVAIGPHETGDRLLEVWDRTLGGARAAPG
jgi:histidinol-phosphate aminotransferase